MLKSVQVEIKEFEILAVDSDRARFRARVASGTYMRSVAHDMGRELACGAHLESLRRTSVAEFTLEDAHTLEEITKFCHPDRSIPLAVGTEREADGPVVAATEYPGAPSFSRSLREGGEFEFLKSLDSLCIHPRKLLPNFPSVTADEPTAARIRSGRTINLPDLSRAPQVKVFANQRDLIAIATRIAGTLFHPKIVLL